MRILIKEKDKRAIKIVFPNFIINVGLRIAMRCMKVAVADDNNANSHEKKNSFDGDIDKENVKQGLKEYIVNEVNQHVQEAKNEIDNEVDAGVQELKQDLLDGYDEDEQRIVSAAFDKCAPFQKAGTNQKNDEKECKHTNYNKSKEKVYFGLNQFQGLDKKLLKQALKELKKYKGLEIVNVESKDEKVSIVI